MLRVSPASKRKFTGMAGLVDVNPRSLIFLCAPQRVQQRALAAHHELMGNVILESLRIAEEMVAQENSTDVWAAEARAMRGNALVTLGRTATACVDYLVARHYLQNNPARRGLERAGVDLDDLNYMIDYLLFTLSQRKLAKDAVRPFKLQIDPNTCSADILRMLAKGQEVDDSGCTRPELRRRLVRRRSMMEWTNPHGEMLLIPDDSSEPRIVQLNSSPGQLLGCTRPKAVRELLFSEEILEQRKGNERGIAEGNWYSVWECIYRADDAEELRPNTQARALLHARDLMGPVLVQIANVLKNTPSFPSRVLVRFPPSMEQLRGKDWREQREEWLALNEDAIFAADPTYTRLIDASQTDPGRSCRW